MVELKNVTKFYNSNGVVSLGLKNINLRLNKGEIVAICGESGSGKSTLLNVITKMDTFDEGEIYYKGEETSYFDINDMDKFRKNKVGFIFQNYNIIESYSVLHNVMLPYQIAGFSEKEAKEKALELIKKVGLIKRVNNKGSQLSGGEKQRCVIARALAYDCEILACDEPTGNLDSKTGKEIVELIKKIAPGKLVLIVTHNFDEIKDIATRKITIADGEIITDEIFKPVDEIKEKYEEAKELEIKNNTCAKISFNNLRFTPKKTTFISIIMLLISFVFFSGVCFLAEQTKPTYSSNYFPVKDKNLVYVSSNNQNELTDEYLKNNFANYEKNPYEKLVERQLNCESYIANYSYGSSYRQNSFRAIYDDYFAKFKLVEGKLPSESNEVCLSLSCSNYNLYKTLLNKKIFFNNAVSSSYYIITGISIYDNSVISNSFVLYGNEEFKNQMKLYGWSIKLNNSLTFTQNDSCYKKGAKTTLYLTNEYYEKYIQEKNSLNVSLALNSNGYFSKSVDNVITDFKIEKSNTQFNFLEYGDDVKFDNINCALIRDKKANNVLNTLSNAGYSCANTYDIVTNPYQYFTIFDAVLSVAAIIVIVIGIYIITYMILHIIYKSKKNDYNIMRTLGVTNKSMRKIVNYEMLIISSISALVVSIVFLTVSSFVKNSFTQLYTNCNILYYLLYIALMIGLSLLITTRFNRRLFKFSVNNSFEGRIK